MLLLWGGGGGMHTGTCPMQLIAAKRTQYNRFQWTILTGMGQIVNAKNTAKSQFQRADTDQDDTLSWVGMLPFRPFIYIIIIIIVGGGGLGRAMRGPA